MANQVDGFWTQPQRDPKRAYRWLVMFPNMPNGATWYAKKVKKPKINVSKTEHTYLNHTFKYPGRVTWDDVSVTLVDPVSPDAAQHLAAIIQGSGYIVPKTFNDVTTISKARAIEMIGGEVLIIQFDESITEQGAPLSGPRAVEVWTLKNPWIMDVDFGELDYESDDLTSIELTLAYDYATLSSPDALQDPIASLVRNLLPLGKDTFDLHGS